VSKEVKELKEGKVGTGSQRKRKCMLRLYRGSSEMDTMPKVRAGGNRNLSKLKSEANLS